VRRRPAAAQTLPVTPRARLRGGGTSVVAFDIYFFSVFPRSIDKSRIDTRGTVPPSYAHGEQHAFPRRPWENNICIPNNIMYIRIRRTNGRESILYGLRWFGGGHSSSSYSRTFYKHIHIYIYQLSCIYAYLYFIDKEIVCVQVRCVSACNDDNMSARPMGSRTCLIIRSYGNYVRTHTHTHTHSLQTGVRVHYWPIILYTRCTDRITDNIILCVIHVLLLLLSSYAYNILFICI